MSDTSSTAPKKRKWHTKDQMGCTRCKARRVKCEKSQPSCHNCVRRGEICIYPAHQSFQQANADSNDISLVRSPDTSQPESSFSALDLQLFHRFITTDYPSLPSNSLNIWTQLLPVYAHDYDFLMHAMLAYSAASKSVEPRPELLVRALHHRTIALNRIWGTMAVVDSGETSSKTRDALLGAWYLLVFQCFRFRDGWTEFIPLLRGINLVAHVISLHDGNSVWSLQKVHVENRERIREEWKAGRIERPHPRLMSGMLPSFHLLETMCHEHMAKKFLKSLTSAATALGQDDTWEGYEIAQSVWKVLSAADSVDSKALEDCSIPSTRTLIAHWLAIMLLLAPFYHLEVLLGKNGVVAQVPTWIFDISRVASSHSDGTDKSLQWPLYVAEACSSQDSDDQRPHGEVA